MKDCLGGVTIAIVDFEQEADLVVGRLAGELVHRSQELAQGDGPGVVVVEDLEHPLREEWLEQLTVIRKKISSKIILFLNHTTIHAVPRTN